MMLTPFSAKKISESAAAFFHKGITNMQWVMISIFFKKSTNQHYYFVGVKEQIICTPAPQNLIYSQTMS